MAKSDFKTIDQYIGTFPKDVQAVLEKMRATIKKAAPGAIEVISYQLSAFKLDGRYLIYLGGFAKHVSLYPVPKGDKLFIKEIAPFVKGKGTIQFQLDEPLPMALITKIVKFRAKEKEENKK